MDDFVTFICALVFSAMLLMLSFVYVFDDYKKELKNLWRQAKRKLQNRKNAKMQQKTKTQQLTEQKSLVGNHADALTVESFRLPEITQLIKSIESSNVKDSEIQYQVASIKDDFIPNTLHDYYSIDESARTKLVPGKNKTPTQMVSEQFGMIMSELTKINDALNDSHITSLEVRSKFLKDKYKQGSADLTI